MPTILNVRQSDSRRCCQLQSSIWLPPAGCGSWFIKKVYCLLNMCVNEGVSKKMQEWRNGLRGFVGLAEAVGAAEAAEITEGELAGV